MDALTQHPGVSNFATMAVGFSYMWILAISQERGNFGLSRFSGLKSMVLHPDEPIVLNTQATVATKSPSKLAILTASLLPGIVECPDPQWILQDSGIPVLKGCHPAEIDSIEGPHQSIEELTTSPKPLRPKATPKVKLPGYAFARVLHARHHSLHQRIAQHPLIAAFLLINCVAALQSLLSTVLPALAQFLHPNEELKKELEDYQDKNENLERTLKVFQEKQESQEKEIQHRQEITGSQARLIESCEHRIATLEDTVKSTEAAREDEQKSHDKSVKEHIIKVATLTEESRKLHVETTTEYDRQIANLIGQSQAQCTNHQAQVADYKNELTTSNTTLARTQAQLADRDKAITSYKDKVGTAGNELASMQAQSTEQEAQVANCKSDLATSKDALVNAQAQVTEREAQITDCKNQLAASTDTISHMQAQIVDRDQVIDSCNSALVISKTGLTDTQAQLSKSEDDHARLQEELTAARSTIDTQLQTHHTALTELDRDYQQLIMDVIRLMAEKTTAKLPPLRVGNVTVDAGTSTDEDASIPPLADKGKGKETEVPESSTSNTVPSSNTNPEASNTAAPSPNPAPPSSNTTPSSSNKDSKICKLYV